MPDASDPASSSVPAASDATAGAASGRERHPLVRFFLVEPNELFPLVTAFAMVFFTFCSYFILRPIRDAIQSEQNLSTELPWVVTATLVSMLVCNAIFSLIASRLPRRMILPVAYQVFVAVLGLFFFALERTTGETAARVAQAFYVWISVFNLLAISTAWSVVADTFTVEQSRRLFARISIGATAGAMSGSAITKYLVEHIGPNNLLLVSAALLEVAVLLGVALGWIASRRSTTAVDAGTTGTKADDRIGGSVLDGVRSLIGSRYLILIALYIFLYTITSTFLSIQQSRLLQVLFDPEKVENARALRTQFSANISFISNCIVLGTQLFLTSHITRWIGVGRTLFVTPIITVIGFAVLTFQELRGIDSPRALMFAMIARSSMHYAVDKPSREALYSPLARDEKYKAKNLIDTFIYRGGDTVATWMMALASTGIAFLGASLGAALAWTVMSGPLGRAYERRAAAKQGRQG
jgi:AAA family ATP:ADP antiporter